jgi:hypothetical protein
MTDCRSVIRSGLATAAAGDAILSYDRPSSIPATPGMAAPIDIGRMPDGRIDGIVGALRHT